MFLSGGAQKVARKLEQCRPRSGSEAATGLMVRRPSDERRKSMDGPISVEKEEHTPRRQLSLRRHRWVISLCGRRWLGLEGEDEGFVSGPWLCLTWSWETTPQAQLWFHCQESKARHGRIHQSEFVDESRKKLWTSLDFIYKKLKQNQCIIETVFKISALIGLYFSAAIFKIFYFDTDKDRSSAYSVTAFVSCFIVVHLSDDFKTPNMENIFNLAQLQYIFNSVNIKNAHILDLISRFNKCISAVVILVA